MNQHLESLLHSYPIPTALLFLLGSLSVLSVCYRFSRFFFRKFIRPAKNLLRTYGQPGSWAIVTGASDGIGKAFCQSLAQRGFNICFIARNPEKLETARKEIQGKYPKILTEIVVADFSQSPKDPH